MENMKGHVIPLPEGKEFRFRGFKVVEKATSSGGYLGRFTLTVYNSGEVGLVLVVEYGPADATANEQEEAHVQVEEFRDWASFAGFLDRYDFARYVPFDDHDVGNHAALMHGAGRQHALFLHDFRSTAMEVLGECLAFDRQAKSGQGFGF
jgi:hypothetical protein